MKKILAMVLILTLLAMAPAFAKKVSVPTLGMEIEVPEGLSPNISVDQLPVDDAYGIVFSYINSEIMTPLSDAVKEAMMGEDEAALADARAAYLAQIDAHSGYYCYVLGVETASAAEILAGYELDIDALEVLGSNSTHTYYLAWIENEGLGEEDIAKMEADRAAVEEMIASLNFIEVDLSGTTAEALAEQLQGIETTDMNGNPVTAEIFTRADVTIVNIWATSCAPCISEMPELAAWAKELPEGVQLIGLLSDVSSTDSKTYSKAVKILEKSGAEFTNLLYNETLEKLCRNIAGTPTTLFLDSNGNSVHEPVIGADMEGYKTALKEILGQ